MINGERGLFIYPVGRGDHEDVAEHQAHAKLIGLMVSGRRLSVTVRGSGCIVPHKEGVVALRGNRDWKMRPGESLGLLCGPDCKCTTRCTCSFEDDEDDEDGGYGEYECTCGYVCPCDLMWFETSRTEFPKVYIVPRFTAWVREKLWP